MAGSTLSGDEETISAINVTPLVDIVLVILIIFIVTASFLLRSSIPLELPRAQTGEESAAGLLTVAISLEGDLFLDGHAAKLDDIPDAVARTRSRLAESGADKPLSAFVSADVGAHYGRFAAVVDRLRLEGVDEIAMDTQPAEIAEAKP